jgi:protein-disulfide isomerase
MTLAFAGTMLLRAQEKSALRPPKGAKLALIVFQDMQCPKCGQEYPLLLEAARTYGIPLVQYDFPLPYHAWSRDAAVMARYFESKSPKLGNEFRAEVFAHQVDITKDNLRELGDKFAAAHKVELPVIVDPQGKFNAAINADAKLGVRLGINHTPTLYVVGNRRNGPSFVEVTDNSNLYSQIDEMKRQIE